MSSPNPRLLRTVTRNCVRLDEEAMYDCFKSFLGEDGGATRTLKEVLIRSFGIYVIALSSYGHLISVQQATFNNPSKAFAMLLMFVVFPELPVAQLIIRVVATCLRCLQKRNGSYRYWLAACLGIHVSVEDAMVAMGDLDPANVQSEKMNYNSMWIGRLILLMLLLVQYSGHFGIWYRSLYVFHEYGNAFGLMDARNSGLALGGMFSVIQNLLITTLNFKWRYIPENVEQLNLEATNPYQETQQNPELRQPPDSSNENSLQRIFYMPRDLRSCCRSCTAWWAYLLPDSMQHSIEGAIALGVIMNGVIIFTKALPENAVNPLPKIFFQNRNAFSDNPCAGRPGRLAWHFGHPILILNTIDVPLQPYIALFMIFGLATIRLFARNKSLKRRLPRIWKVFDSLYTWCVDRKSSLSSLIFLAVVTMHLWIEVVRFVLFIDYYKKQRFGHGSRWERLMADTSMYKDPWYDTMYIL